MKIPLSVPFIGSDEKAAVAAVMDSGWLAQGKKVAELERLVADYLGGDVEVVAVSSGTAALHLTLLAIGRRMRSLQAVRCPSYTFVATANAALHAGLGVKLEDIDGLTYNWEPQFVPEKGVQTGGYEVKVCVSQAGLPCRFGENLFVVEDAACALGATRDGYKVGATGSFAYMTTFSMHASKAIIAGEGGMIVVRNPEVLHDLRLLRNHGASIEIDKRQAGSTYNQEHYVLAGFNYRMSDLHAAVAVEQVKKIDDIVGMRRKLAARYNLFLPDGITRPFEPPEVKHTFQRYLVRVEHEGLRENLLAYLWANGVSARRGIQTIHREPYWIEKHGRLSLPVTEFVADTTIQLPLYPSMTVEEQDYVIGKIEEGLKK